MLSDILPDRGLAFGQVSCNIFNSSGTTISKGDLLKFDIQFISATNAKEGDEDSIYYHVVVPPASATGGKGWAFFCVADADIAQGFEGKAWVQHPRIKIKTDAAVSLTGLPGVPGSGTVKALKMTGGAGQKVVALPLEASAGPGLSYFNFDGIVGFGAINV